MKTLARVFAILFTAGLGFMMLVNVQPWMELARELGKQINIIPFADSLVRIPYLGGWIEWIAVNIAQILGIVLWAIVQFIEVLPMLIREPNMLNGLIEAWSHRPLFKLTNDNSAIDKLKQIYNNLPIEWLESLERYRGIAYAVETIVCFLRYPPYEGGIEAIIADAPNWDTALIDWWNMLFFVITMFGFELCFKVIMRIWQGLRYMRVEPEVR